MRDSTQRGMRCRRRQSAPSLVLLPLERVCEWPNDRMCWLQGLELLVTVLLARNRQPPPTVAAGVPRDQLAAELITLPSGLLAMVCEAIVALKVSLKGCLCVYSNCIDDGRGPTRSRRMHGACPSIGGGARLSGSSACMCRSAGSTPSSTGPDTLQVSDVARPRRDSQRTGALRRSSRLSTLRAGASP